MVVLFLQVVTYKQICTTISQIYHRYVITKQYKCIYQIQHDQHVMLTNKKSLLLFVSEKIQGDLKSFPAALFICSLITNHIFIPKIVIKRLNHHLHLC